MLIAMFVAAAALSAPPSLPSGLYYACLRAETLQQYRVSDPGVVKQMPSGPLEFKGRKIWCLLANDRARVLYGLDGAGAVFTFAVTQTGTLRLAHTTPPVPGAPGNFGELLLSPSKKALYHISADGDCIVSYLIGATGLPTAPMVTRLAPGSIPCDNHLLPNGSTLVCRVSSKDNKGSVLPIRLSPDGRVFSTGTPVPCVLSMPIRMAPNGGSLYQYTGRGTVAAADVSARGELSPFRDTGLPTSTPALNVFFSPNSTAMYVSNRDSIDVYGLTAGRNPKLIQRVPAPNIRRSLALQCVASPDGKHLYLLTTKTPMGVAELLSDGRLRGYHAVEWGPGEDVAQRFTFTPDGRTAFVSTPWGVHVLQIDARGDPHYVRTLEREDEVVDLVVLPLPRSAPAKASPKRAARHRRGAP